MPVNHHHGGNDPYPEGAIIMWNDAVSEIPYGWALCDGQNGTPDLRNRFPRSVPDTSTDPGATGGANNITLSTGQLPSHDHTGSTSYDNDHQHELDRQNSGEGSPGYGETGKASGGTAQSDTTGSHGHSGSLGNTGGGNSMTNTPAYVEMTFIQKLDSSNL